MNFNIEFLNDSETIGVFFDKKEALKSEQFITLRLTINALCGGHFSYFPYENFENDLLNFIKRTNANVKTIFVKIETDSINFGFLPKK